MSLGVLYYPKGTAEKPIEFKTLCIPHIYKEIYIEGVYGDVFGEKKDMVIIDIGANIGIVSQYMRDYAKKIYAIEPSSDFFEALQKNKEANNWDNVELFNLAIADRDSETMLNTNAGNRTMCSITDDYKQGGELVKTMAMDTFFEKNKIDKVDFIKLDAENAEDMILRSGGFRKIAPKVKAIEVEFHNKQYESLIAHMMGLGYHAVMYSNTGAAIALFTRYQIERCKTESQNL